MKQLLEQFWIKIHTGSKKFKVLMGTLLVLYVVTLFMTLVTVKEEMVSPAFFTPVSSVIQVDEENKTGNVYTVAVYVNKDVSLFQKLLISLNYQVTARPYDPQTALTNTQETDQGRVMKEVSITNSIITAYLEAQKTNNEIAVSYAFEGMIIHTITPQLTPQELQIGDVILAVNDQVVTKENFATLIQAQDANCSVSSAPFDITVRRRTQTLTFRVSKSPYTNPQGETYCVLGIGTYAYYHIDTDETLPTYTIQESRTLGPSGGLMQTIAVYNAITATDITNGLRIAGTGTIDVDGKVGNIGGVAQKVIAAQFYRADVFFVPVGNYEEALEMYERLPKTPHFALVAVETFADAIAYLLEMEVA